MKRIFENYWKKNRDILNFLVFHLYNISVVMKKEKPYKNKTTGIHHIHRGPEGWKERSNYMFEKEAKEEMSKAAIDLFCENLKESHEIYYDLCPEWVAKHTVTKAIVNAGLVFGTACGTAPKQVFALACIAGGVAGLLAPSKKIERLKDKQIELLKKQNDDLLRLIQEVEKEDK